ncbi:TfoX/Sxy family protein [Baekduia soli]|uniref:TfoX/Sxy family protein n=1 Tax=Baekduia soli TaxID=496014 RepID=A0A5B8UA07_9ACTN|nr:TfoX/Sxy family protein [Baekduia soli]QEC49502.1 TfoX/Sxy family protein [Baekduia soli]
MPYDEDLANRLRELLSELDAVTERKMFGGLAFMVDGHLAVAASRTGGLLVRLDPADTDAALARPHAERMVMGGRSMDGWILVAAEGVRTRRQAGAWVRRSLVFIATLPPK